MIRNRPTTILSVLILLYRRAKPETKNSPRERQWNYCLLWNGMTQNERTEYGKTIRIWKRNEINKQQMKPKQKQKHKMKKYSRSNLSLSLSTTLSGSTQHHTPNRTKRMRIKRQNETPISCIRETKTQIRSPVDKNNNIVVGVQHKMIGNNTNDERIGWMRFDGHTMMM